MRLVPHGTVFYAVAGRDNDSSLPSHSYMRLSIGGVTNASCRSDAIAATGMLFLLRG